jgi:hypothetical protein
MTYREFETGLFGAMDGGEFPTETLKVQPTEIRGVLLH